MADIPVLLALSDLVARWTYTRAGVQRLINVDPAFPGPVAVVNRGRTRIWDLAAIEAYETSRPWLLDAEAKVQHMRGNYVRWVMGSGG